MRMGTLGALMTVAVLAASPADIEAARADYAASVQLGQEPRYLALSSTDPSLIAATMFMVTSSSRSSVLDGAVPRRIPGTGLLRIDLRELGWAVGDWMAVCGYENNPTTAQQNPLVVNANWLTNELADGTSSGAYFRLMFGKDPPKTVTELLALYGIDRKKQNGLQYGVIPKHSGVNLAKNASRLLEHSDGVNSEVWLTYDVLEVKTGADPLEGLFSSKFKFNGIEGFLLLTRVAGTKRVVVPIVFLANEKEELVFEAPAALVSDETEVFGDEIIRSPASCYTCHTGGSQPVGENALELALRSGVELRAYDYAKQREIEFFHLAQIDGELERWDTGFAEALKHINGLSSLENAAALRSVIADYRKDVTLEQAALELSCKPERLRLALAWASSRYIAIGNRLSGMAHGDGIPRSQWEEDYLKAKKYLEDYTP